MPESIFDYKLFVAKLNNDFEPIWCIPAQRVRAAEADNELNIYIAGINDESLTIGDTILDNIGSRFLVKLDPEGNPVWINFLGNENIQIQKISLDGSGNIYLSGEESYATLSCQGHEIVLNPPGGMFLLKFSPSGDLLWGKALGLRFYSYLVTSDGDFFGAYLLIPRPDYNVCHLSRLSASFG